MNRVSPEIKKMSLIKQHKTGLILLAYISPFMMMVIIFNYIPIFGWAMAFVNYKPGIPIFQSSFVGFKYFQRAFSLSSDFWIALRNTLALSFINIAFSVVPVVFAVMISQVRMLSYSRVIQTLSSIPNFISWILIYSIVFYLIGADQSGLNKFLLSLGFISEPLSPLINPRIAWIIQPLIGAWKSTGYAAIIYLAAISGIDPELYQAADVDGASGFQKIIHVTLPGISSTYFVLLLLAISNLLSNGFEQYWLFGNGLTWNVLEVFDTYVYRMGIEKSEYAFATAIGIFKSLVSVFLLTIANFLSKLIRGESIF
ncbi:MAG: ABC transporter permease subunit [Treponema sp.]|jgi:ABC-type polysaccharide transport system permease subunit|nr:ABC transporter permease subunit [Treponema sp.]